MEILYKKNKKEIEGINLELIRLRKIQERKYSFIKFKDIFNHFIFGRNERDNKGNANLEREQEIRNLIEEKNSLMNKIYSEWAKDLSEKRDDEELKKEYELLLMGKRYCEKNLLCSKDLNEELQDFAMEYVRRVEYLKKEIIKNKK